MQNQDHYLVVDDNGIPDHIMDATEITTDGFDLACKIGASRGNQEHITAAISEMLTKYQTKAGYVFASALTQLGRDLIPMVAELAKTATGIDWAKHCEFMYGDDYDPSLLDVDPLDQKGKGEPHG